MPQSLREFDRFGVVLREFTMWTHLFGVLPRVASSIRVQMIAFWAPTSQAEPAGALSASAPKGRPAGIRVPSVSGSRTNFVSVQNCSPPCSPRLGAARARNGARNGAWSAGARGADYQTGCRPCPGLAPAFPATYRNSAPFWAHFLPSFGSNGYRTERILR